MEDPRVPLLAEALREAWHFLHPVRRSPLVDMSGLATLVLAALPTVGLALVTNDALERAGMSPQQMLDLLGARSAEPTE
jgi:hypothetical protein